MKILKGLPLHNPRIYPGDKDIKQARTPTPPRLQRGGNG